MICSVTFVKQLTWSAEQFLWVPLNNGSLPIIVDIIVDTFHLPPGVHNIAFSVYYITDRLWYLYRQL